MAVEAKPVHHGTRAKGGDHRASLIDYAEEGVGAFDPGNLVSEWKGEKGVLIKGLKLRFLEYATGVMCKNS